ncbi:M23 family metallopeptidase [Streptomyces sp. NPDC058001]|uniref:M23 family metallopeptidase n=1 Tax=Streptomyces sp. NPDC058001 TaxID=3346300 RepID=UPI0036E95763
MNDPHPSGTATPPAPTPDTASAHYAQYDHSTQHGGYTGYEGYDAYGTGSFTTTTATATGSFESDPLFGDMPGNATAAPNTPYDSGQWPTAGAQYTTGTHQTLNYDGYAAQHHAAYDTGAYDTTGVWESTGYQHLGGIPAQGHPSDVSGQWDAQQFAAPNAFDAQAFQTQPQTQTFQGQTFETQTFEAQSFEAQTFETQTFDTGAYDATAWNSDGSSPSYETPAATYENGTPYEEAAPYEESAPYDEPASYAEDEPDGEPDAQHEYEYDRAYDQDHEHEHDHPDETVVPLHHPAPRSRSRARRRSPAKRSALLTVAVPSACVMGVAGIAAASVGMTDNGDKDTSAAAPDPTAVEPSVANSKLDTQLANLSADAGDFADRASRTQERIDLKAKQEQARKEAAEEAARKERLRPKFMLPVKQQGLSAYFGQAGANWMSLHTGIDFPVSYGTPVMAATDGTVRTQLNSAYGTMAIVTAADGTETWYCHLSTYKIMSGTVKAGDVIAYSGDSGKSTGPHLHFEVRPGGGAAIDPLPWLRSHGIDPT